jgi:hypothetical protein
MKHYGILPYWRSRLRSSRIAAYLICVLFLCCGKAYGQAGQKLHGELLPCSFNVTIKPGCQDGLGCFDLNTFKKRKTEGGGYVFSEDGRALSFRHPFWSLICVKIIYSSSDTGNTYTHTQLHVADGGPFEMKVFQKKGKEWKAVQWVDENTLDYVMDVEIAPAPVDSTTDFMFVTGDFKKTDTGLYKIRLDYRTKCGGKVVKRRTNDVFFRLVR